MPLSPPNTNLQDLYESCCKTPACLFRMRLGFVLFFFFWGGGAFCVGFKSRFLYDNAKPGFARCLLHCLRLCLFRLAVGATPSKKKQCMFCVCVCFVWLLFCVCVCVSSGCWRQPMRAFFGFFSFGLQAMTPSCLANSVAGRVTV